MLKNEKGTTTLALVISYIVLALAVGVTVFLWKDQQNNAKEVMRLKQQIDGLTQNKTQPDSDGVNPMEVNPPVDTGDCTICDSLPVVIYAPGGLFTETEKEELKSKLVDPFFDFYNETQVEYITMKIEKYEPLPDHGYKYNVEAINKNGGYLGFLYGQSSPLEWWTPECMGGCDFSPAFELKYPEIIDLLE